MSDMDFRVVNLLSGSFDLPAYKDSPFMGLRTWRAPTCFITLFCLYQLYPFSIRCVIIYGSSGMSA